MKTAKAIAGLLLDPRGRMSRQDLLAASVIMVAVDMLLSAVTGGIAVFVVKGVAYWIGGVGVHKRLHDIGRSGWWLAGGLALLCMWSALIGLGIGFTLGLESIQPGNPGYIAILAAILMPSLGAALWLHLAEGEKGMNRFGAESSGILAELAPAPQGEGAASGR
jgi:uncharacterized membrane protein YhaH (DUF805 family)